MNEIVVHVEVEVNPTEDLEKVKLAVENIFGAVKFKVESRKWGQLLIAETTGTEGLTKLYNLLSRERIRAAARKVFFSGMDKKIGNVLSEQASCLRRTHFLLPTNSGIPSRPH